MKFDAELPNCREGVFVPQNFATPKDIVEVAQLSEKLGYHALWTTDFLSPTPQYGIPSGEKPNWYEPLSTITYCAAQTEKIRLGTGLILAPFRDPIILAKQVATIDHFCDGRFFLGLGLGMCRDEFEALKPNYTGANRGEMMDECIDLLRRFFSDEIDVRFKGKYHSIDGANLYPKPRQNVLPIYVPCRSEKAYPRITRWNLGITAPAPTIPKHVEALRPMLEAGGIDPNQLDAVAEGEFVVGESTGTAIARYKTTRQGQFRLARQDLDSFIENNWVGTVQQIIDKMGMQKNSGISHFNLLHIAADTVSEHKEILSQFAEEIIPSLQ
ncbi:MAG: TIGR03619 family F420-dependent LLM class oxidoreductase [Arenicellales bacterium]|nr:TIGR03619 family F420-dependent LLM class oxidoreductase [Arenicellales bacterium]